MKIAVSAMWLSESSGVVFGIPFAGPQCAASAASSSQLSRYVLAKFDSCHVISPATVGEGGARQSAARTLRQPLPRKSSGTFAVVARRCSKISGCGLRFIRRAGIMALHNKPLVPTRNGAAPLLAAQRRRWAETK